jgi:hypothetical protein
MVKSCVNLAKFIHFNGSCFLKDIMFNFVFPYKLIF